MTCGNWMKQSKEKIYADWCEVCRELTADVYKALISVISIRMYHFLDHRFMHWCEVCRELASDVYKVEHSYSMLLIIYFPSH